MNTNHIHYFRLISKKRVTSITPTWTIFYSKRIFIFFNCHNLLKMFRASTITDDKLRAQAAGSFVSNRMPPTFTKPESHPVMKMIKGGPEVRKHQLVTSTKTDGLITIYNNRVITLNVPQIGYDPMDDEDENTPLITGAVGLTVSKAYPAYVSLQNATSDFFYLGRECETTFFSGVKLPPACFTDSQSPVDEAFDKPFFDEEVFNIRVPLTMPLLKGTDILEGSITDPDVIESLDRYHAAVGVWARIMKTVVKDKTKKCIVDPNVIRGFGDNCFPSEPLGVTISQKYKPDLTMIMNDSSDDEDSLWHSTTQRIDQIKQSNINRFIKENPDKFPKPSEPSVPKPTTKEAEEEKTLLDGKHSRAVIGFMLALATVNEEDMSVTIPDLSRDFVECFQWETMELICRTYKSCIQDFMTDRQEHTRDFFYRRINGPLWSSATLALYLKGIWHDHGLDDNRHNLSHSISVLNFLADPPASNNAEYLDYLKKSHLEDLEALVEEASDKRQKIGLKVFLGGKQDSPEDIITCLANMDAHFAFIVSFDDKPDKQKPLMVRYFRKIADVLSSKEFVSFVQKFITKFPWIPHMILLQVQLVFSEFATIARNNRYISMVRRGQEIPYSVFGKVIQIFEDSMRELGRAITQSNVSHYSTAPPTYFVAKKSPDNDNRKDSISNDPDDKKNKKKQTKKELFEKGWFLANGSFSWPESLSCRPCNKFGQVGAACFRRPCTYVHKVFPEQFSEEDRKIIAAFEASSPVFSFAHGVSYTPSPQSGKTNTPPKPSDPEPAKKKAKVEGEEKKEGGN